MLLYDVFYSGRCFDRDIPLPSVEKAIELKALYAKCTNGEVAWLVPTSQGWEQIEEKKLLDRFPSARQP